MRRTACRISFGITRAPFPSRHLDGVEDATDDVLRGHVSASARSEDDAVTQHVQRAHGRRRRHVAAAAQERVGLGGQDQVDGARGEAPYWMSAASREPAPAGSRVAPRGPRRTSGLLVHVDVAHHPRARVRASGVTTRRATPPAAGAALQDLELLRAIRIRHHDFSMNRSTWPRERVRPSCSIGFWVPSQERLVERPSGVADRHLPLLHRLESADCTLAGARLISSRGSRSRRSGPSSDGSRRTSGRR